MSRAEDFASRLGSLLTRANESTRPSLQGGRLVKLKNKKPVKQDLKFLSRLTTAAHHKACPVLLSPCPAILQDAIGMRN